MTNNFETRKADPHNICPVMWCGPTYPRTWEIPVRPVLGWRYTVRVLDSNEVFEVTGARRFQDVLWDVLNRRRPLRIVYGDALPWTEREAPYQSGPNLPVCVWDGDGNLLLTVEDTHPDHGIRPWAEGEQAANIAAVTELNRMGWIGRRIV